MLWLLCLALVLESLLVTACVELVSVWHYRGRPQICHLGVVPQNGCVTKCVKSDQSALRVETIQGKAVPKRSKPSVRWRLHLSRYSPDRSPNSRPSPYFNLSLWYFSLESRDKTATTLSITRDERRFEADGIGKVVLLSYDHFSSTAVFDPRSPVFQFTCWLRIFTPHAQHLFVSPVWLLFRCLLGTGRTRVHTWEWI